MRRNSDKPLPTSKTNLYTALVETILTRYLAKHPTYKEDDIIIDIDKFTDLRDDVYPFLSDIMELAYKSVAQQQLFFKNKNKPVQHLSLMDVVAELFPTKHNLSYSYNFLHLSIQEYFGAVTVSLMDTNTQEGLLEGMCMKKRPQNMAMILAGITQCKGMNQESVKQVIQSECRGSMVTN